jgi:hypothetical protein
MNEEGRRWVVDTIMGAIILAGALVWCVKIWIMLRGRSSGGNTFGSFRITVDGAACDLELQTSNDKIVTRLSVLEAKTLSDALLSATAKMQLARQGGKSVDVP